MGCYLFNIIKCIVTRRLDGSRDWRPLFLILKQGARYIQFHVHAGSSPRLLRCPRQLISTYSMITRKGSIMCRWIRRDVYYLNVSCLLKWGDYTELWCSRNYKAVLCTFACVVHSIKVPILANIHAHKAGKGAICHLLHARSFKLGGRSLKAS